MTKRLFNKNITAVTFMVLVVIALMVILEHDRKEWERERLSISHVLNKIGAETE